MSQLIIVTCGTSLSETSRCWKGLDVIEDSELDTFQTAAQIIQDLPNSGAILKGLRSGLQQLIAPVPRGANAAAAADAVVKDFFREEAWSTGLRHLLPAELATLHALQEKGWLPADATILLCCGKSNWREASLVAAVWRRLAADIRTLPSHIEMQVEEGEWDPVSDPDFRGTLERLWEHLEQRTAGGDVGEVAFVLTGGYKGLVIDLALRLGGSGASISLKDVRSIFYLHDGDESIPIAWRLSREPGGGYRYDPRT